MARCSVGLQAGTGRTSQNAGLKPGATPGRYRWRYNGPMEFRRKNIRLPRTAYIGPNWYFLTICTQDHAAILNNSDLVPELLGILAERAESERFALQAYCFMPDHLHLRVSGESESSDCMAFSKYPPAEPGALPWVAPQRGLIVFVGSRSDRGMHMTPHLSRQVGTPSPGGRGL